MSQQQQFERAADMLTAYGELIRRDGASHVEEHHYVPEVEAAAAEMRALAAADDPRTEQLRAALAEVDKLTHEHHQVRADAQARVDAAVIRALAAEEASSQLLERIEAAEQHALRLMGERGAMTVKYNELLAKQGRQEPVGWQSRFSGPNRSDTWAVCSREHHDTVLANPQDWTALPGDVYEVRALYAEPVFPRPALSRESIADAVADLLGNGVYTCQRQWSAWSYGTMGPDDFVPSSETELPMEIADAVAELLKAAPASCAAGPSKAIQHDRSVMDDIGAIPGGQS